MRRVVCLSLMLCLPLAACNTAKLSGVDGLAFGAVAGVVPPPAQNVQVIAKITNISAITIQVTYGGCAVVPVFHSGGFNGPVVFDPRPGQVCPAAIFSSQLNSGDALQVTGSAVPNLPAGTYYVTAVVTVNGTSRTVNASAVTF
jgi:hypothetical protein